MAGIPILGQAPPPPPLEEGQIRFEIFGVGGQLEPVTRNQHTLLQAVMLVGRDLVEISREILTMKDSILAIQKHLGIEVEVKENGPTRATETDGPTPPGETITD